MRSSKRANTRALLQVASERFCEFPDDFSHSKLSFSQQQRLFSFLYPRPLRATHPHVQVLKPLRIIKLLKAVKLIRALKEELSMMLGLTFVKMLVLFGCVGER